MKRKRKHISQLEKEKETLNEMGPENIIYDETQTGPQEEPFLFEYNLDLEKWKEYQKEKEQKD